MANCHCTTVKSTLVMCTL